MHELSVNVLCLVGIIYLLWRMTFFLKNSAAIVMEF